MAPPNQPIYDTIGTTYTEQRRPDPRVAASIHRHLKGFQTCLNVGAGTGSYEPDFLSVIALEPSTTMISQRASAAAPCVCGVAEGLPFADNSFDCVLASLTVHHWSDMDRGIAEMHRVAQRRIIVYSWDPNEIGHFWLVNDYFPEIMELDRPRFPPSATMSQKLGGARVETVPIPRDCQDGFLGAFWARPHAYLEESVIRGNSAMQQIPPDALERGLAKLREDLASGTWQEKYGALAEKNDIDLGYRLYVSDF